MNETITYTILDGTSIEITEIQADADGNKRFSIFDPSGKYSKFTCTPNGHSNRNDSLSESQKLILKEIEGILES